MSVCAILAYLSSGLMIQHFGSLAIFRMLVLSSAVILVAGCMNWFGDSSKYHSSSSSSSSNTYKTNKTNAHEALGGNISARGGGGEGASQLDDSSGSSAADNTILLESGGVHSAANSQENDNSRSNSSSEDDHLLGVCCGGLMEYDKHFITHHKNLFFLSSIISWCAIMLSVVMMAFQHWAVRLATLTTTFLFVATTFFVTATRSGLPEVAKAGLFIFLSNAVTPDIETAMFYWYTNAENGPQFSPQFVGYISGLAFACMFFGILLYNRYLSTWPYRKIFSSTMVFLALMNLTDVILVKRWNLLLGVPDEVMVLGDCALSPMARRFYIMPLYILAAKVCPSGAEATVFAILTALGNFGSSVSVYSGSLVLQYFDISDENYSNLVLVICLKSASRLLPLLLVPILVPRGAPFEKKQKTPGPVDGDGDEDEDGGGDVRRNSRQRHSQHVGGGGYQSLGGPEEMNSSGHSNNSISNSSNNSSSSSSSSSSNCNSGSEGGHFALLPPASGRVDKIVIGTSDTRI
jgi:hypothetical protein